mmetsp:Transcript_43753/g.127336  ORF Transcript_43753/g.127336 Transcript_43753/m.127336 type:complete len:222 (+) Transcript_43753:1566-2231(+)
MLALFDCIWVRMAQATCSPRVSMMIWHLARTASIKPLDFFFSPSAFADIFNMSRFASSIGPWGTFGNSAVCAVMASLTSSACLTTAWLNVSASSVVDRGVPKASSSSLDSATMVLVASSNLARAASVVSSLATAGASKASAAFRSLASMWAFASFFSFFANSVLPSATLLLSFCKLPHAAVYLVFNLPSSCDAEDNTGSFPPAASSLPFSTNNAPLPCTAF